MHLSRLTTAEMIPLSRAYLDPADPAHQAIASVPELANLLPRLGEAHEILLASQSQDELHAGSVQSEVVALDAKHDDLVHGIDAVFRSLALLLEDDEERSHWARLHELLMPGGGKQAELSYQIEALNATLLRHILNGMPEGDRARLSTHSVGGRSLLAIIEQWIAVGEELGQKEQETQALPTTPVDAALQSAQHQWVRIVGAMVSMMQMASLLGELPDDVKQHVLGPLHAATERGTSK